MTETKKNLVEIIKGIKKGKTYGLSIPGFSSWNDSNLSGLLEAITQIKELEAFPDFVGEYIGPKELEILLRKNIIISDSETKNALSFLPKDFLVKALKKENILGLSNKGLALITPEQWSMLPEEEKEEIVMQLAKANRLQYLSEESLEFVTKKLNLYHRYGVNIASSRLTESELKTQLTSLIETGKLGHLAKEAIGTITNEVILIFGNDFLKQLLAETIDHLATVEKICALDINLLPVEEFKKLKTETIAVLTSKQIGGLDEDHLLVLKENPLLINSLGKNFSIIKDVTGIDINSLNEATLRFVTNEQLEQFGIEKFKLLCDTNKSQYLIPQIVRQIPDEYLLYLTEYGLTKDQAMFLNERQFGLIRNSIKPEIISAINANIIAKDQEFLKNLTVEQAENLTEEQARAIQGNDMLSVIPDNVLFFITSKIKNRLSDLNENTLDRIARNRNEDIPMLDSDPKLTGFETTIDFGNNEFNEKNIKATIKDRIKNENWKELKDNCFYWVKNKEQKSIVYKILNEEMNSRPTTVYGLTDKIQLLLATIPLSPDNKQLTTNYQNLEKTIISLINEPSYTVDEYLTKSDLYSSLIENNSLNIDLREMICREQVKLMERDFVDKFYTISGRNSLYSDLREEISKAYLNYANILVEKYGIDTDKFAKELTEDEEINLRPEERKYLDCIAKIYTYTPDLENKVRYWAATATRLLGKAVLTCVAAKAAVNSGSKLISLGTGLGATAIAIDGVNDVIDVADQKSAFSDWKQGEKKLHKKERKGEIGILKKVRRFFGRVKNKIMVSLGFKKNKFSIKKLPESPEKMAKSYLTKTIEKQKQRQLTVLDEKVKEKEESMLKYLKNKEKSKQIQLIEDNIEIRIRALKIIANKKAMALENEYPEFKEKGFFSKFVDISKNILNGSIEGFLDTVTLGCGGDIYKQIVNGVGDEKEKARRESRLAEFRKKSIEINEWLVKELDNLRHERCQRLASANEIDKQKFEELEANINAKKEEINQEMGIFKPEEHIKLDKNNLLPSLTEEKILDVTKLDVITEDLETLINDDKISPEIKMHNIENTNKVLEKNFNSGNLDLKDPKVAQNIFTTLMVMNQFIAAQLAVTCIAVVANEVEKKRQELEKEQAKINNIFNDMQVKLQEIGVNPLNIDDTRIPIHV